MHKQEPSFLFGRNMKLRECENYLRSIGQLSLKKENGMAKSKVKKGRSWESMKGMKGSK